jgi:cellulose synthase/poly-beta-1,6-N-acetylglucosamine synthase-like glycosyltransferase
LGLVVLGLYLLGAAGLFIYGVNCYYLVTTFLRTRGRAREQTGTVPEDYWEKLPAAEVPPVTIQLPIFNERYVIERLLGAVAALDYPRDRLEVQVLDDSNDETVRIAAEAVERYRKEGLDVRHIRRNSRVGFKAGALEYGLQRARGEFVAIFDADFMPGPDFLRKTVPHFGDPEIALVQTRWGHLNEGYSFLTRAQGIGIDGHFIVEQNARAYAPHFMNFNGTAGIWRASAIHEAGGWQHDTLTEDLDLSYRAQLKGWRMLYLAHVVTPAELPPEINAFKTQQHRWAKGSIQTARKLLPVVWRSPRRLATKIQATIHLTGYMVHPLMLLTAILTLPLLLTMGDLSERRTFMALGSVLSLAFFGPSLLYTVSQAVLHPRRWWRRLLFLPVLIVFGTGIAVNNTRAVLEALLGIQTGFIRTPKWNIRGRKDSCSGKKYRSGLKPTAFIELAVGLYCLTALVFFILRGAYAVGPFLLLYATAFLVVGSMSLSHSIRAARARA